MRLHLSTRKIEPASNLPHSAGKKYLSKSDFRRSLASGHVSDFGDVSSTVETQLNLLKQLSRFDIGDYVVVTTFKDSEYKKARGRIIGYKKLPNLVMGIQEEEKKKVTNIDINPCNYGDLSDLEVRRSGPRVWVELLNIKTGEVPTHILRDWSMSKV